MRGMKKIPVLALACALLLTGCSAMLNRPYEVVTPHEYHATAAEGSGVPVAGTYQALVNDIFSFVEDGAEHGVVRLSNYTSKTGDVAGDLNAACNEVANEDPLGAYAVDFIKSGYTRVVKYYEVTIDITYRRTPEQIKGLVNVTGSSAIREELRAVLREFRGEAALRVSYFTQDTDYIGSLIRQAYFDTPEAALGMPEFTVALYPGEAESGPRIVEILLSYPEETDVLRKRSDELLRQTTALLAASYGITGRQAAQAVLQILREQCVYAPGKGRDTAYAALVQGRAGSEGMALAYLLLAQQMELEAGLIRGTLDGESRTWDQVRLADGTWRHVDASREDVQLLTDEELSALGYDWVREEYPACRTAG